MYNKEALDSKINNDGKLSYKELDYLKKVGEKVCIEKENNEKFKTDIKDILISKFDILNKIEQLKQSKNIRETFNKNKFTNEDVALIQLYISITTGESIKIDGILGPKTIGKIKSYNAKPTQIEEIKPTHNLNIETWKLNNTELITDLMIAINSNLEFKAGIDFVLSEINKSNSPIIDWYKKNQSENQYNEYEFFFYNYFSNIDFINLLQNTDIKNTSNSNISESNFFSRQEIAKSAFKKIKEKIDQLKSFKENQVRLGNEFPKLKNISKNIYIDNYNSPSVKNHINELNQLNPTLINWINEKNILFYLSSGVVTDWDTFIKLKSEKPRGWSDGMTWEIVPGLFSPLENIVVAGNNKGHGCQSLFLHELGHGLSKNSGIEYTQKMKEYHIQFYDKLSPYLQQGGPGGVAGLSELTAESFAEFGKLTKSEFVKQYSEEFWNYWNDFINNPRTV